MAKRKPEIRMRSFGIYTPWDSDSKELPDIQEFTTRIPAIVDIEFGYIVKIVGAKNQELEYCIDHPGILDSDLNRREPFVGTVYVKTNDWNFFLGDTIWLPHDDKVGNWRLTLQMGGNLIADKTFEIYIPNA